MGNKLKNIIPIEIEQKNLEFILSFVLSNKDMDSITHKLLLSFQSVYNICNASIIELTNIDGVSIRVAEFLTTIPKFFNYYQLDNIKNDVIYLDSKEKILDYGGLAIKELNHEEIVLLSLSKNSKLLGCKIFKGDVSEVNVTLKESLHFAYNTNANNIIVIHNHPSGQSEPSISDIIQTKNMLVALRSIRVNLSEHIIVSKNNSFSFKENGIIDMISTIKFKDENKFTPIFNNINYRLQIIESSSKLSKLNLTEEEKMIVSSSYLAMQISNQL